MGKGDGGSAGDGMGAWNNFGKKRNPAGTGKFKGECYNRGKRGTRRRIARRSRSNGENATIAEVPGTRCGIAHRPTGQEEAKDLEKPAEQQNKSKRL